MYTGTSLLSAQYKRSATCMSQLVLPCKHLNGSIKEIEDSRYLFEEHMHPNNTLIMFPKVYIFALPYNYNVQVCQGHRDREKLFFSVRVSNP